MSRDDRERKMFFFDDENENLGTDLLSTLDVTDEFRAEIESLFNDSSTPLTLEGKHFSETEFYYLELMVKRKQFNIDLKK